MSLKKRWRGWEGKGKDRRRRERRGGGEDDTNKDDQYVISANSEGTNKNRTRRDDNTFFYCSLISGRSFVCLFFTCLGDFPLNGVV